VGFKGSSSTVPIRIGVDFVFYGNP
jgi:hypothetical protein